MTEIERPRRKKPATRKAAPAPSPPEQQATEAAEPTVSAPEPRVEAATPQQDVVAAPQAETPPEPTHDLSALRQLAAEPAVSKAPQPAAQVEPRYAALASLAANATATAAAEQPVAAAAAAVDYPQLAIPQPEPLPPGVIAVQQEEAEEMEEAEEEIEEAAWQDTPGELETSKFFQLVKAYRAAQTALGEFAHDLDAMTQRASRTSQNDVWRLEPQRVLAAAQCRCGNSVQTTFESTKASVDTAVLSELRETLAALRASSGQTLPLRVFGALMAKTRVQLYMDTFVSESETFRAVAPEDPVIAVVPSLQTLQTREDIGHMQHMLSVLFFFERSRPETVQPEKVPAPTPQQTLEVFHADVRKWILALGALLLRRASFQDHLFLLQHLLCCPSVAAWGAGLLQFPPVWNSSFVAEHFVHVVSVFVRPISRSRQPNDVFGQVDLQDWQVVSADGTDSIPKQQQQQQPRRFQILEEDFLALFEQLPFGAFCTYLMQNKSVYQTGPSSSTMLSDILKILSRALSKVAAYRDFAKLLTKLISSLLVFVAATRTQQAGAGSMYSLGFNVSQQQFDDVFLQMSEAIIKVKKETSLWQFLSDLPFASLSDEAAWQFLGLAHFMPRNRRPRNKDEWIHAKETAQPSPLSSFAEACSSEDGTFLTQAIAALGRGHGGGIAVAVLDSLFHVAVVDRRCRALAFKSVCGLMASMCECTPSLISHIFELLDARLDEGFVHVQAAHHLVSSLPLVAWTPTSADLSTVSAWLMADIGSAKHAAARSAFDGANLSPTHMDVAVHRRIAFLLIRGWQHHIVASANLPLLAIVSRIAANNAFAEFESWCWQRLLSLCYFLPGHADPAVDDAAIINSAEEHIKEIFAEKIPPKRSQPMLIFAACMLSSFGVDPQSWIGSAQPILTLLKHLIYHQKVPAAALVLQQVLPRVEEAAHGSLLGMTTPLFLGVVREIAAYVPDQGYIAFFLARKPECPSTPLRDTIFAHLSLPPAIAYPLAEFWLRLAATQRDPSWIQDTCCQKIVATVFESWFLFKSRTLPAPELIRVLQDLLPPPAQGRSSVLSLRPVVTNFFGVATQSFKDVPWLSFVVLCMQMHLSIFQFLSCTLALTIHPSTLL